MNECQFAYIIKKDSTSTSFSQNILQKSWGLQIETRFKVDFTKQPPHFVHHVASYSLTTQSLVLLAVKCTEIEFEFHFQHRHLYNRLMSYSENGTCELEGNFHWAKMEASLEKICCVICLQIPLGLIGIFKCDLCALIHFRASVLFVWCWSYHLKDCGTTPNTSDCCCEDMPLLWKHVKLKSHRNKGDI